MYNREQEIRKVNRRLRKFPKSLLEFTDGDLQEAASIDFTVRGDLTPESSKDLYQLRLYGFSILQFLKKDLRPLEGEDLEWYEEQDKRSTALDTLGLPDNVDLEEMRNLIKENMKERKEIVSSYLDKNLEDLLKTYHREGIFWLEEWYDFQEYNSEVSIERFDYQLYFSILSPKPPLCPLIGFHDLVGSIYIRTLKVEKPRYLEYCWQNEEIRNKVLRGEVFDWNTGICSYYDIKTYIERKMAKEKLPPLVPTLSTPLVDLDKEAEYV